MATNKNALIRYKTIDKCLQNRHRRWTLNDLIDACSDALYEYEGKDVSVSKRTVQLDIQMMRSEKLGYEAPIIVYDKKYYTYEDPEYSITNIPLTETDMDVLSESVEMLKQFKDFSLFSELNGIIQKLDDKIHSEKNNRRTIIHFEKNEQLKGLQYLDTIYQSILKKIVLEITYKSFTAKSNNTFIFTPFILKEYNNRWFTLGRKKGIEKTLILALDRIVHIDFKISEIHIEADFDPDQYFKDTYGVTVLSEKDILDIELIVDKHNAPYVLTKPIHHSQQLLESYDWGGIKIGVKLHHNFELERLILGFGESMRVVKPRKLKRKIHYKLKKAIERYEADQEESDESDDNLNIKK